MLQIIVVGTSQTAVVLTYKQNIQDIKWDSEILSQLIKNETNINGQLMFT